VAEPTEIAAPLLAWARAHGRHDLPWQRAPSPYTVWLSEVMLQQTRVATASPYFERFRARFPTLAALAAAPLDEVLAHWSGLGYYTRARNLHAAARRVVAEHGGELPRSLSSLAALPGIGRSTAGAILALAHGQRQPICDGNVRRILLRIHGIRAVPVGAAMERQLWALAEAATPPAQAPPRTVAAYTQAIMDLGALVCTPKVPRCPACPLAEGCRAAREGVAAELPTPRPGRRLPVRTTGMVVVLVPLQALIRRCKIAEGDQGGGNRVLLVRRPETGIWGGLWSLPEVADAAAARAWCALHLGERIGEAVSVREGEGFRHTFTHFHLDIAPYWVRLPAVPIPGPLPAPISMPAPIPVSALGQIPSVSDLVGEARWIGPGEGAAVGIPAPVRRILSMAPPVSGI
jgi:A/G-specific adenine glycosylase